MVAGRRSFLFLQGMACDFFARLGLALQASGHSVHRINFNAGDRLFWPLPGAFDFRAPPAAWPAFLAEKLAACRVTDVILFGDCRPLHRAAILLAHSLQLAVHVCEEGYLRPGWVTFERDGVNGNSTLSRDPDWYRATSRLLPPLPPLPPIPSSFGRRARHDLAYNLTAIAFSWLYPHYQTHRPRHRLVEYYGWSRKMAARPFTRRLAAAEMRRITLRTPFFLLPLQLDGDTQVTLHSRFGGMRAALAPIIDSFARHAPADTLLVVKEHPLDDGLTRWRRVVADLAARAGVADRVRYLPLGDLERLIANARGVVTVNSTTGTLALAMGIPVITLGQAIYNIAGLTHQGPLHAFWTAPMAPDGALFAAFRHVVAKRCLLAGNFFSEDGLRLLVRQALLRLETGVPMQVSGPGADHAPGRWGLLGLGRKRLLPA